MKLFYILSLIALSNQTKISKNIAVETGMCFYSKCGNSFCANHPQGNCISENQTESCVCSKGYSTSLTKDLYYCCYKQKSFMTAFYLELFLSFGIGHFYVGNLLSGIVKLLSYVIIIGSAIVIVIIERRRKELIVSFHFHTMKIAVFLLLGFIYVGWQMVDCVLFTLGGYTDGNGVDLY